MTQLREIVRVLQPFLQVTGRASEDVARQVLQSMRTPDMEMVRRVAEKIGMPAADVDLAFTHMVEAIMEGKP